MAYTYCKSAYQERHCYISLIRNPTGLAAKVLATIQANPNFFQELASH